MPRFTEAAHSLLRKLEGCRLTAYADAGGVPTIGWGHTGPEVVSGLVWTQQQCDEALDSDVQWFIDGVSRFLNGVEIGDDRFSALVIFAFNVGLHGFANSSALREVLAGNLASVPAALALYNKVRVKGVYVVNAGLVKRRVAEAQLWNGIA